MDNQVLSSHISAQDLEKQYEIANRYFQTEDYERAVELYSQILHEDPNNVRALHAIGVILHHQSKPEEAIDHIERALKYKPDYLDAYCSLGKIYNKIGCFKSARDNLLTALALDPNSIEVLNELSFSFFNLKQYDIAETYLTKALQIEPEKKSLLSNQGNLRKKFYRFEEAIDCYQKVLQRDCNYIDSIAGMASIYMAQGCHDKAIEQFRLILNLKPNSFPCQSGILFAMHYNEGVSQDDVYRESIACEAIASQDIEVIHAWDNPPDPDRKLRIGLVSPDFRRHPVGYFIQAFLMLHDFEQYEVVCYCDYEGEDDLTLVLKESADIWRRTYGVKDIRLAEMIRRDGIDILVDLAGHTNSNRLAMFAMKPAPVQVTWAGYVGTTGFSAIDYLISDRFQSPEDAQRYTVEQIIRLPNDYICYCPPDYAPDVSSLPALSNGYVTFCCFNNLAKVSNDAIALWSEVLKSVDGSRLFMKNPSFDDKETVRHYLDKFACCGISSDRIVTEGRSPHAEMLGRYSMVDIQLDTCPYSGGLTTLESIWMGVPVITLPGELFSSRHSLSHLMNVGLDEFVASTREEFIHIVSTFAKDIPRLSEVRSSLRDRMMKSPVCDGISFADDIQQAFRGMWQKWCADKDTGAIIDTQSGEKLEVEQFHGDHIDYNDRGNLLSDCGRFDVAIECYDKALEIKPEYMEAAYNLGLVYSKLGALDSALQFYKKAIRLDPDFADAHLNLSSVLISLGRNTEALTSCQKALVLRPDFAEAYNNIGTASLNLSQPQDAYKAFQKSVEIRPDFYQAHSNILYVMHFLPGFTARDILAESRKWDAAHAVPLLSSAYSKPLVRHTSSLRVGFVSPDLYRHPVGYFVQSFFLLHDRDELEIICYSDANIHDEMTDILRDSAAEWNWVYGMSDEDLARKIHGDGIDILIDLAGHSNKNRLLVFARKPAPIQATWAGYIGTTGLSSIDYLISDYYQSPDRADEFTSEEIIRLPGDYISYCPPDFAPDVSPLPASSNGYVTFCSFNKMAKVSDDALELWSEILKRVDGSHLFMKNPSLADPIILSRVRLFFEDRGIISERLILEGPSPHLEVFTRYETVDIQLDSFPYSGGLTTLESLWMGVPVVTLPGELFSSRHSLTHLMNAGLSECVASTPEEFISIACALANDHAHLAGLRGTLREKMMASTICDGLGFAENMNKALRHMWQRYLNTSHLKESTRAEDASFEGLPSQIVPDDATILRYNHGIDCMENGRLLEAEEVFAEVIRQSPLFLPAYNNLAMTVSKMGRLSEAEAMLQDLIKRQPHYYEAHNNLGNIYIAMGRSDEALPCFRKALELEPKLSSSYSNMLFCMNYLPEFSQDDIFSLSQKWRDTICGIIFPAGGRHPILSERKNHKIRIGYVSADFRFHSVSFFIRPLFDHHDREHFEIFCFSNVTHADAITYELQQYADKWVDISAMTDTQAVQNIRNADIDILVDLSGHTSGNRLGIFLAQPAPVQISWLGYPNTTGLSEIGYRITDEIADPKSSDAGYSETLYRMPKGFLCYQPPDVIPDVTPLPSEKNDYITFCSFNTMAKLNDQTISTWSKILHLLPNSRLMLKSNYKCSEPLLHRHIVSSFEKKGIDEERIEILPSTDTLYAHLNKYSLADIALDAFPYNGTTTTFEALLMGVPVVTLSGIRHASRVGASILTHLGEPDFIAQSPDEFCAIVLALATDRSRLKFIRSSLRSRLLSSSLCNGVEFVRMLEDAYYEMLDTSFKNTVR